MTQTDVQLPGVLPLVLSRTHVSSYRVGRWFGPSWASTLDQRLEVDTEGVCFAAGDGMLLYYPTPGADGQPVLPAEGPRLPLSATLYGYQVTDPVQGRTWHFTRPGDETRPGVRIWALSSIADRNGNRIDLDYDEAGVLTGLRHSGGYHIRVEIAGGRITALHLVDPDGGDQLLMRYGYDASRQLTEVYNSTGQPMVFDYDPAGRMISWTDRIGGWYRYDYDSTGRCVRTTGADGVLECRIVYDPQARTTTVADSLGHVRRYQLNHARQIVQETDPLGRVTTQQWDRYDRLLSRTDPLGRTTTYTYDDDGNLTALTRPDGARTTSTYNHLRLPVTITEPDGATRRFDYDQQGNLIAVTDPVGATTRYGYRQGGHLADVVDPTGGLTRVTTDAAGLPSTVTSPDGGVTRYGRDSSGRVVTVVDPLGGTTQLSWTGGGKVARRVWPDGTTERWAYDPEGNLTEYTDPAGNTTQLEVGPFELVTARTGPDGQRFVFDYDTELRLVAVTNPDGLVWRYEHDQAGRLVAETDFNGRTQNYGYDLAGQLEAHTTAGGRTVTLTRDPVGRITQRASGTDVTTFAYDRAGRLVRATNPEADLSFVYDPLGRVTAETCNGRTIHSAYDVLGRRVRRRTSSGAESEWEYDLNHQPVALHASGHTIAFTRDAIGRETERWLDDGVRLSQSWDANHRLSTQTLTAARNAHQPVPDETRMLQRRSYQYRPDGYVIHIEDQYAGSRAYDLDAVGRVTAVRGVGGTEQYVYDPSGNLTHAAWPAATPSDSEAQGEREYDGTLITRAGAVQYQHDADGRMVTREVDGSSDEPPTWRYTWDAEDRLSCVTTPDGQAWRYCYDPLGRRIAKQRVGGDGTTVLEQTIFVWDGPLLAEQIHSTSTGDHPRTTVWEWEPRGTRPVAQSVRIGLAEASQEVIDQRFYAIVTDLIGTPNELVDPAGSVVWSVTGNLWGVATSQPSGQVDCPLRFPGQYHDQETGLHYNVSRYYDPDTARYTSSDPLGLAPAPNPHTYVHNPLTWLDPLGLNGCDLRIAGSDQPLQHNQDAFTTHGSDGFSGVYHPPTGQWQARVSGGDNPLVDRLGGHGTINREVFGGSSESVGFVAIRQPDGTIQTRWNSGSVNAANFGDRAAPLRYREAILDALRSGTGLEFWG